MWKNIIIGILAVALLGGIGYGIWRLVSRQVAVNPENKVVQCNGQCIQDGDCATGFCSNGVCRDKGCVDSTDCVCQSKNKIVRADFMENFYDGKLDDFWIWNDGGNSANKWEVDNVREELRIKTVGENSQWTTSETAPSMRFSTDKDFVMEVEFSFDPKVDFQHAGLGVMDPANGEWVRISRSYDTHALENQYDIANSLYVMEKKNKEIVKYKHVNFGDVKTYVRMTRKKNVVSFEYSRNGKDWFEMQTIMRNSLSDLVDVYLFAYSTVAKEATMNVKLIDFTIVK